MKILHCCLAAFYIDDYSYQENILPKIHKMMGYDVEILASTETYLDNKTLGYTSKGIYTTKDGILLTRIPYIRWIPHALARKLRLYEQVDAYLESSRPDIIFMHDCQFLSVWSFVAYAKKYKVRILVDCHTDFINSGRNWVSKNILHKLVYRRCAKTIEPYTAQFYGTLPLRIEFLNQVYGISKDKIELLPFGADDTVFKWSNREMLRLQMRVHLNLNEQDKVFITGGKIDKRKNIHLLASTFVDFVEQSGRNELKLIVFGKPADDLEADIKRLSRHPSVRYVEWIHSEQLHKYFFAADVAFFPGTHSVLWEEAVGLGVPCIFLRWKGVEHVDLGGNCVFIDHADKASIRNVLLSIVNDDTRLERMKKVAMEKGPKLFSYIHIARKAIEQSVGISEK